MDTLEGRVAALERENRAALLLLAVAAVLLLASMGGVVFMWRIWRPPMPVEVRAHSFALVDQAGKERASIYADKDGPRVALKDDAGEERVALCVDKDGPRVSMWDGPGKERVLLQASKEGPVLCLRDAGGEGRVILRAFKGACGLNLCDEKGRRQATIWSGPEEGPNANMGTEKKRPAAYLALYDKAGRPLWWAPQ